MSKYFYKKDINGSLCDRCQLNPRYPMIGSYTCVIQCGKCVKYNDDENYIICSLRTRIKK